MPGLMLGMQKEVSGWLLDEKVLMDDLAVILKAYRLADTDDNTDVLIMLRKVEDFVISHFLHLTPNQASQIMICYGEHIQSTELVNICEKTISANLDSIVD